MEKSVGFSRSLEGYKNSIPSKSNLKRCRVILEDICDYCKTSSKVLFMPFGYVPISPLYGTRILAGTSALT